MRLYPSGIATLLLITLLPLQALAGPPITIDNPYDGATWAEGTQRKASLHVHTTASDGKLYPHEAIDAYKALAYEILAITDHDRVSYPWTKLQTLYGEGYENRDPETVGMADVQGNELSRHHHMGSYWTDHTGTETDTEEDSLKATAAKHGQMLLCHPGRYDKPIAWYVDLFTRFDHLTGMEVFNQGDRYPDDRKRWDAVLTELMPARPVWGYSNDDMHKKDHLGHNWNVLLINEKPNEARIRKTLEQGCFYFVYSPEDHATVKAPRIDSITVDHDAATISIKTTHVSAIEWISEGTVIGTGSSINLSETEGIGSYVRAMLHGTDGRSIAGTQPFGLHYAEE